MKKILNRLLPSLIYTTASFWSKRSKIHICRVKLRKFSHRMTNFKANYVRWMKFSNNTKYKLKTFRMVNLLRNKKYKTWRDRTRNSANLNSKSEKIMIVRKIWFSNFTNKKRRLNPRYKFQNRNYCRQSKMQLDKKFSWKKNQKINQMPRGLTD